MQSQNYRSADAGFTLIELLVVITIIGILAVYFGPKVLSQTEDAKFNAVYTEITNSVPEALASYFTTHDPDFPESLLGNNEELWKRGVTRYSPWSKSFNSETMVIMTTNRRNGQPPALQMVFALSAPGDTEQFSENLALLKQRLEDQSQMDKMIMSVEANEFRDNQVHIRYRTSYF